MWIILELTNCFRIKIQVDEDPDLVPETTDNTFQFDAANPSMPDAGNFNF